MDAFTCFQPLIGSESIAPYWHQAMLSSPACGYLIQIKYTPIVWLKMQSNKTTFPGAVLREWELWLRVKLVVTVSYVTYERAES